MEGLEQVLAMLELTESLVAGLTVKSREVGMQLVVLVLLAGYSLGRRCSTDFSFFSSFTLAFLSIPSDFRHDFISTFSSFIIGLSEVRATSGANLSRPLF